MNRPAALAFGLAVAFAAGADEGMWTYENFPKEKVFEKYGFKPDDRWPAAARAASSRPTAW